MRMCLYQTVLYQCSCCKQNIFEERRERDRFEVSLVGAKKFSACILCGQIVNKEDQTPAYKKRWMKIFHQIQE